MLKCSLGLLLLAATKKGICAVRIGDSSKDLIGDLKNEFKNADISETNPDVSEWSKMLIDYLAGNTPWPRLPFDVRATAFQRRVWDYLRTIPEGQTMHYSEIAAAIGQPKATRAVARACATNPVALVRPCHRVLPKTGGVGGYLLPVPPGIDHPVSAWRHVQRRHAVQRLPRRHAAGGRRLLGGCVTEQPG